MIHKRDKKTRRNEYRKIVFDIVQKYLPECKIYLYGSRARDKNREGSDIDIALDTGTQIDRIILGNICSDLEDSDLPVSVDVIDVASVSTDFLNTIKTEWVPWVDL